MQDFGGVFDELSSMLLTRLKIRGFKSLADVELEPGLVNVLVGANGSGKSNLLEALGILGAAASGRVDDESLDRRNVRIGTPSLYKSAFQGRDIPQHISLEAQNSECSYSVSLGNPLRRPQAEWQFHSESFLRGSRSVAGRSPRGSRIPALTAEQPVLSREQGLGPLIMASVSAGDALARLLNSLRDYAIFTPATAFLRGIAEDHTKSTGIGLHGGRLAEAIRDLLLVARGNRVLKQHIDRFGDLVDWIDQFGARSPDETTMSPRLPATRRVLAFHDRYMREERNWLSAYDASEGVLYTFFMMVVALSPSVPTVLAVDNFDQAMNPRLARETLGALINAVMSEESSTRQLFLTTHNPLSLDALDLKDDRVRLFTVERTRTGTTRVDRVLYSEHLEAARSEGLTLSRLWLSGRLGGMPNL